MQDRKEEHLAGLAGCLSKHFGGPVEIHDMRYMTGGASRVLARFTARVLQNGVKQEHNLVFRLDPPASFVESDRGREFRALKALESADLPIPRTVFLDETGSTFGTPFFIMTEVTSGRASEFFSKDPYGEHAVPLGRAVFKTLGRLAAVDVDSTGLSNVLAAAGKNPAATQLDYWESVINADEKSPTPIVRAAIRALRRRMPIPPAKISVVHGDMRSGNFLANGDELTALLDWEFVHLGDPLEDIAWCADPLWTHGDLSRVGGMLPLGDAIAAWESTSEQKVDPKRLDWWRLFTAVKGMAMWVSATDDFLRPDGAAPAMAVPALTCTIVHERLIAETLWRWETEQ